MNRDDDMKHVKPASKLAEELAEGKKPYGMYGDSANGMTFTDEQSELLIDRAREIRPAEPAEWRSVWAGPGVTQWTVIDCSKETEREREFREESMAS